MTLVRLAAARIGGSVVDDERSGVFKLSLLPVLFLGVAWIVVIVADLREKSIGIFLAVAIPVLSACLAALLSVIQIISGLVEDDLVGSLLCVVGFLVGAGVVLAGLDIAGVVEISRLWSS
jgi:hypothetical protein